MKIIKNSMTMPITITCPECGSVLEYTYKDINREEPTTISLYFSASAKRYIVCPVCKRDICLKDMVEVKEAEND